jgi:hypothetical protein
LVGIKNHGLNLNEFVLFLNEHWEMDADFHITILHDHLVRATSNSNSHPRILYLQGDNSAAESKNKYFLYFCGLLVHLNLFDEVYYSTMIAGHTHEDIDQLFQAIHNYLTQNSALTIEDLLQSIAKAYTKPPLVIKFKRALAWKTWFANFCNPMKGHSKLHCFLVKKPTAEQQKENKISDLPRLFVKQFSSDDNWSGGADGLGHILFVTPPAGRPGEKLPAYSNLSDIQHSKFASFMDDAQKNSWKTMMESSGQNVYEQNKNLTVFDIAPQKQLVKSPIITKTDKPLVTMKHVTEETHEWKVSQILGQRINKGTHQTEYHVLWEAGDETYEPEEHFYDTDGVENEIFTAYKKSKKRGRGSSTRQRKKRKTDK